MGTLVSLLVAVLLVGCSSPTDPTTADYWLERLDGSMRERIEALKELGKIGDPAAAPAVIELLKEEGDWQPDAAYALGQIGHPSAVAPLLDMIEYSPKSGAVGRAQNRTNRNIIKALAMLEANEGVDPLIRLAGSSDDNTREAALEALAAIGDPKAAPILVETALQGGEPPVRQAAVKALGEMRVAKGVPALIRMMFEDVPGGGSFYPDARYALLQIGEPAVAPLIETLQRKNKDVEAIRNDQDEPLPEGIIEAKAAYVLGALRAVSAEGLMLAALGKYYKRAKKLGKSPANTVAAAVSEIGFALADLGSKKAAKPLRAIALDTHEDMRSAATEALVSLGDRGAVDALLRAARSGSPKARQVAVVGVSRLGGGEHLKAFDALVGSGGSVVPRTMMKMMLDAERARLVAAKECKQGVDCWKSKLGDKSSRVRERAAYELGWRHADAVTELMQVAEDDDASVRWAAVLSLGRYPEAVDARALQALHDRWDGKIDYNHVNAEMRRILARLRTQE